MKKKHTYYVFTFTKECKDVNKNPDPYFGLIELFKQYSISMGIKFDKHTKQKTDAINNIPLLINDILCKWHKDGHFYCNQDYLDSFFNKTWHKIVLSFLTENLIDVYGRKQNKTIYKLREGIFMNLNTFETDIKLKYRIANIKEGSSLRVNPFVDHKLKFHTAKAKNKKVKVVTEDSTKKEKETAKLPIIYIEDTFNSFKESVNKNITSIEYKTPEVKTTEYGMLYDKLRIDDMVLDKKEKLNYLYNLLPVHTQEKINNLTK